MDRIMFDIVIIGGGAAGMMLAAGLDLGELRGTGRAKAAGAEADAGREKEACAGSTKAAGAEAGAGRAGDAYAGDGAVRGLLLEGSPRVGTKLMMSGGGRCNITHGGSARELVGAYGDAGRALRGCLYKHNNLELARWLDEHGVPLADENGRLLDLSEGIRALEGAGRIFPASMETRDILGTLKNHAERNGWKIEIDAKVLELHRVYPVKDEGIIDAHQLFAEIGMETGGKEEGRRNPEMQDMILQGLRDENLQNGGFWELTLENGYEIRAKNIVIATGGITYPETGSDGSMFGMLEDLGVEVTEPRPALAPVYVEDYPYVELAGVSVPNVTVVAFSGCYACEGVSGASGEKLARMKGDLLFTHEGLSGPVILNISKYAEPGGKIRLIYNKEFSELPRRMQKKLRDRARGPLGDVKTNVLASLLGQDDFTVKSVGERGMVTSGGVSLKELDLKTMKVKRFDEPDTAAANTGLYVIGEAIDADGISGGYNLQLCWSTACTAADDLRSKLKRHMKTDQ